MPCVWNDGHVHKVTLHTYLWAGRTLALADLQRAADDGTLFNERGARRYTRCLLFAEFVPLHLKNAVDWLEYCTDITVR